MTNYLEQLPVREEMRTRGGSYPKGRLLNKSRTAVFLCLMPTSHPIHLDQQSAEDAIECLLRG